METITDIDRDALHVLPLSFIPIETSGLARARLIKNARLESMVELFGQGDTGSGQLAIDDLPSEFQWPDIPPHPDLAVLRKLAELPSFDVYGLRISLREAGIAVNDHSALRLSAQKRKDLTDYMSEFTRPLIMNVYGNDDLSIREFDDIVALFRQPDARKALAKLKIMAHRLEIEVAEIPKFLEDYGDVFLSLAYYRQCLDRIQPILADYLDWMDELCESRQARLDPTLTANCRSIQAVLSGVMLSLMGRFDSFDSSTRNMWSQVSAARFRQVERLVKGCHTNIGGILCPLTVKLQAWSRVFHHKRSGGPSMRAEFIMSEMLPGIEKIQQLEKTAPILAEFA